MIVCTCNCVTKKKILERLKSGLTVDEIIDETGAASDCGSCIEIIEKLGEKYEKNNRR